MTNRPDFSIYLAHFTKDSEFCVGQQGDHFASFQEMNAKQRLVSILEQKKIFMSTMPWTNLPCVCFTECPWSSLLAHTKRYSSYGIGFTKKFIFNKHGAPALYMRANIFEKYRKHEEHRAEEKEMWTFVTPFSPEYGNEYTRRLLKKVVDYTHEREWRVPEDLKFEYTDVEFIIVKTLDDFYSFPVELKKTLKTANVKVIVMDNYKLVETLWPVHIK